MYRFLVVVIRVVVGRVSTGLVADFFQHLSCPFVGRCVLYCENHVLIVQIFRAERKMCGRRFVQRIVVVFAVVAVATV